MGLEGAGRALAATVSVALAVFFWLLAGGRWLALRNLGRLLKSRNVPDLRPAGQNAPDPGEAALLHSAPDPGAVVHSRVSICVPARDEERVIGRLLASLCAQDAADIEILVIDDHSTDRTGAIVDGYAARDPRVRKVVPPALPDGWLGKNHALHVASQHATGDLLLFVDADTVHHPAAVRTAVEILGDADVLVVLSGQEVGSWAERVVSPFFWSLVLAAVDPAAAEDPARPDEAMGNGQFALFRAAPYRAIGGHEAVRDVVVEDVSLVRRLKHAGARYRLAVGPDLTRTRMYRSFEEVWRGFSKNVAVVRPDHRVGDTLVTLGVIVLVALAELGPWLAFGIGGWCVLPGLVHLAALVWMRSAVLRRICRQPSDTWPAVPESGSWALLQPIGAVLGVLIFCNALRLQWTRGATWKGRALGASRPI